MDDDYFYVSKKEARHEKKRLREKDRSKYKKTDQRKPTPPPKGDFDEGRVLAITSEGITVHLGDSTRICSLKGTLKKEKTREKNLIIIGDKVLVKETQIAYIHPRTSFLSRSDNLTRRKQQLIAANIDQVFIIASVCAPSLKPSLIDRYIIAARKGNMEPVIIINKIDLLENEEEYAPFREAYSNLGIPFLEVSAANKTHLTELKELMRHKTNVFSGQSGVGKSSLLNALFDLHLPTSDVVHATQKGSHTTTTSTLIPLDNDSFCVDTPGIKSFDLWNVTPEELPSFFPEIKALAPHCKYPNCTHIHEPDCAVIDQIPPIRYQSYHNLLTNGIAPSKNDFR